MKMFTLWFMRVSFFPMLLWSLLIMLLSGASNDTLAKEWCGYWYTDFYEDPDE